MRMIMMTSQNLQKNGKVVIKVNEIFIREIKVDKAKIVIHFLLLSNHSDKVRKVTVSNRVVNIFECVSKT